MELAVCLYYKLILLTYQVFKQKEGIPLKQALKGHPLFSINSTVVLQLTHLSS